MSIIVNGSKINTVKLDTVIANTTNGVQNSAINNYLRSNASLATTAKDVVEAVNEIYGKLSGISGAVKVSVVATEPAIATVVPPAIYYIGASSPYNIVLYTKDSSDNTVKTDLGTTSVDLSDYQKKTVSITGFSGTTVEGILTEIATKFIETAKIKTAKDTTVDDTNVYSAKYLENDYIKDRELYKVGDVYETLSTTETITTLATRFGGTWEALPDRIEDSLKQVSFTYTAMNGFSPKGADSTSAFKLYGRVVDANYVELLWNGYFWGNINASAETQLASNVKINGVAVTRPVIIRCISSKDAIYHSHCYISGASKLWMGLNVGGSQQIAVNSTNYIEKSLINLTPDRTFKRFKRKA